MTQTNALHPPVIEEAPWWWSYSLILLFVSVSFSLLKLLSWQLWPTLDGRVLVLTGAAVLVGEVTGKLFSDARKGPSSVLAAIAAGVAYAVLAASIVAYLGPPVRVRIVGPTGWHPVGRTVDLSGWFENKPTDRHFWVYVLTAEPKYYPFPVVTRADGLWESIGVGLGREVEDRGAPYSVGVWLATPEADAALRAIAEHPGTGMDREPAGVEVRDQRTFTRANTQP